jgi:peptide/nickel transport system permease protein
MSPRKLGWLGVALLLGLWLGSFVLSVLLPEVPARYCPLGNDVLRPDRTVCELAFGGLWVSLGVGLAAGALSTLAGLGLATLARLTGGAFERWVLRLADAFFSLPDVLVLMVVQFAGQTLGDLRPELKLGPVPLMIVSLGLVGWAGPTRMLRNRLATLEDQEFVLAARGLGGTRAHLFRTHLWPSLKPYALAIFLSRVPAAILAESTVSFFGIARLEPMSLGRYLGTSYSAILYEGGARVVLPAWALLVLIVLGASLAARGVETASAPGK